MHSPPPPLWFAFIVQAPLGGGGCLVDAKPLTDNGLWTRGTGWREGGGARGKQAHRAVPESQDWLASVNHRGPRLEGNRRRLWG